MTIKKTIAALGLLGLLANQSNAINPAELKDLENSVKNDPNSMKGTIRLNEGYSDDYKISVGDVNYEFNNFYFKFSYIIDEGVTITFYDFNKDGSPEGMSLTETIMPRMFDVADIASGNLEDIKSDLEFSEMKRRLNERMGNKISEDKIYGIHPDGEVVNVDFINGTFSKKKNEDMKKALNEGYDGFLNILREHYKPKKDDLYRR